MANGVETYVTERGAFTVVPPGDQSAIAASIEKLAGEIGESFAGYSPTVFLQPQGDKWSPSEHLQHLIQSNKPLGLALALPKLALLLRFGPAFKASRSYEELHTDYQALLAAGGFSLGRFQPRQKPEEVDAQTWQATSVAKWTAASSLVLKGLNGWSERALDRYRIPHPLLGKLTVREMLNFTLFHNQLHAQRVRERAAA